MQESIGFFEIFWSLFWLFLLVAWFWVVISVVTDVFRSRDLSGVSKALWVGFVILIPWLGVLSYMLIRADKMDLHAQEAMEKTESAQRKYIRSIAQISPADELEKLWQLKEKGAITDEEFAAQKVKIFK